MKYTRIAALTAVSVAAALSLTACGDDSSGKDSSSSKGSSSSASSSDGESKPEGGSGSGDGEAGNAKSDSAEDTDAHAGAANGATKTGSKATFCKTEDLAIDASDAAPDEASGRINITMVNRGSTTCSATGFAGVDIKDADNTSNPVQRGHAQPRITSLKPGDAAVFNLAYEIDGSGNSLSHPTNILVTPPNETHTVSLEWPAGAGEIKGAYTDVEVYPTYTTE